MQPVVHKDLRKHIYSARAQGSILDCRWGSNTPPPANHCL